MGYRALLGGSGLAIAALALVAAPRAAAHVGLRPHRIAPGSDARVVFSVPDQTKSAIRRVAIGLPPDFELGEVEAKPGWKARRSGRTVTWDGRTIMPGQFTEFALYVHAPRVDERAVFSVLVSLANGKTDTYRPFVWVEAAQAPHDEGARTLATAALIVAAVAAVLALGGGFLALWLWLRPRPPDRL